MSCNLKKTEPTRALLSVSFLRGIAGTFILTLILVGCGVQEDPDFARNHKGPATGRPYKIKGKWYHPQSHYQLEEEGIASYYGINDGEHKGPDALGGIYDRHELTAAHKTLPLPCVVHVENLTNGRTVVLAVTDRGPFIPGRVIDVSVKAAQMLGFFRSGTTPVRIRALEKESLCLAQHYKKHRRHIKNVAHLMPMVYQTLDQPSGMMLAQKNDGVPVDSCTLPDAQSTCSLPAKTAPKRCPIPLKREPPPKMPPLTYTAQFTPSVFVRVPSLSFQQALLLQSRLSRKAKQVQLQKMDQTRGLYRLLVGPFPPKKASHFVSFLEKNALKGFITDGRP